MSKHLLLKTLGLAAAMMVAGCEKEPAEPNRNNPDTPQPQPKTYTYYYDANGIPLDTLMAHTDVDTFYVVPISYDLCATWSENAMHTLRNHLEDRQNRNQKTRGKGYLKSINVNHNDSIWLSNFGYNVIDYNLSKSK